MLQIARTVTAAVRVSMVTSEGENTDDINNEAHYGNRQEALVLHMWRFKYTLQPKIEGYVIVSHQTFNETFIEIDSNMVHKKLNGILISRGNGIVRLYLDCFWEDEESYEY